MVNPSWLRRRTRSRRLRGNRGRRCCRDLDGRRRTRLCRRLRFRRGGRCRRSARHRRRGWWCCRLGGRRRRTCRRCSGRCSRFACRWARGLRFVPRNQHRRRRRLYSGHYKRPAGAHFCVCRDSIQLRKLGGAHVVARGDHCERLGALHTVAARLELRSVELAWRQARAQRLCRPLLPINRQAQVIALRHVTLAVPHHGQERGIECLQPLLTDPEHVLEG